MAAGDAAGWAVLALVACEVGALVGALDANAVGAEALAAGTGTASVAVAVGRGLTVDATTGVRPDPISPAGDGAVRPVAGAVAVDCFVATSRLDEAFAGPPAASRRVDA